MSLMHMYYLLFSFRHFDVILHQFVAEIWIYKGQLTTVYLSIWALNLHIYNLKRINASLCWYSVWNCVLLPLVLGNRIDWCSQDVSQVKWQDQPELQTVSSNTVSRVTQRLSQHPVKQSKVNVTLNVMYRRKMVLNFHDFHVLSTS